MSFHPASTPRPQLKLRLVLLTAVASIGAALWMLLSQIESLHGARQADLRHVQLVAEGLATHAPAPEVESRRRAAEAKHESRLDNLHDVLELVAVALPLLLLVVGEALLWRRSRRTESAPAAEVHAAPSEPPLDWQNSPSKLLEEPPLERASAIKPLPDADGTSRRLMARALSLSGVGTWAWNPALDAAEWSDVGCALLGHDTASLAPQLLVWRDLVHPDDQALVDQHVAACRASPGEVFDIRLRLRHRQGHWVRVRSTGVMVTDGDGEARGRTWMLGTHALDLQGAAEVPALATASSTASSAAPAPAVARPAAAPSAAAALAAGAADAAAGAASATGAGVIAEAVSAMAAAPVASIAPVAQRTPVTVGAAVVATAPAPKALSKQKAAQRAKDAAAPPVTQPVAARVAPVPAAAELGPGDQAVEPLFALDARGPQCVAVQWLVHTPRPSPGADGKPVPPPPSAGLTAARVPELMMWRRGWNGLPAQLAVPLPGLSADLCATLESLLAAWGADGLKPAELMLLVSDAGLLADVAAGAALRGARARGVQLALADFVPAPTTLATLQRLPLDIVMLHPDYIAGFEESQHLGALLEATISVAGSRQMAVGARGVTCPEQAAALAELGCAYGQGPGLAPPLAGSAWTAWLRARRSADKA